MTGRPTGPQPPLEDSIKDEARRLGFVLAGITAPDPPPHLSTFETWLAQGCQSTMGYLATERSLRGRADPRTLLPGCRSILVLAAPYSKPDGKSRTFAPAANLGAQGLVAAYAWGKDYHAVLRDRLAHLVRFIEDRADLPVLSRCHIDTGPILERDLAQRAGLGWIGKNTCLINPKLGSYLLLAEILLDLDLKPDAPVTTDHCGKCSRCIDACPTDCILPDRTLEAGRCISFLTIEFKGSIPLELRPKMGSWVFGCDICQMVCPWNRFAAAQGDRAFWPTDGSIGVDLAKESQMDPPSFAEKFAERPQKRSKWRGYVRNLVVALGNTGGAGVMHHLNNLLQSPDPVIREHAEWAAAQIEGRIG